MKMYHGFPVRRDTWDLSMLGRGNDQDGPGFYFTDSRSDALTYTLGDGFLYEVELDLSRTCPLKGRIPAAKVRKLMQASPRLEDALTNWDEDPDEAFRQAFDAMLRCEGPHDAMLQVWIDFYRDHEGTWARNMVEICKYDATLLDPASRNGTQHVVVYNPAIITVVKEVRHAGDDPGQGS